MPRGEKTKYTEKQKRQAEHIAKGYTERGVSEKEAERRAWAIRASGIAVKRSRGKRAGCLTGTGGGGPATTPAGAFTCATLMPFTSACHFRKSASPDLPTNTL